MLGAALRKILGEKAEDAANAQALASSRIEQGLEDLSNGKFIWGRWAGERITCRVHRQDWTGRDLVRKDSVLCVYGNGPEDFSVTDFDYFLAAARSGKFICDQVGDD
jgi:hypothetical protein